MSRAATIARLEAEGPIVFYASLEPNSFQRLEPTVVSNEQDFHEWVDKKAGLRLHVHDKATHQRKRSISHYTDAVKTYKTLEANNEYLYLRDPQDTQANEMAKFRRFEKNIALGLELQTNLAVNLSATRDGKLRDALDGSIITMLNKEQPVKFLKYKKENGERQKSPTTGLEYGPHMFVEADGVGLNGNRVILVEAKTCVQRDHITELLRKVPKLLSLLYGLVMEPQFYETQPAEIKGELIEYLKTFDFCQDQPIALVLSGNTFMAEMRKLCHDNEILAMVTDGGYMHVPLDEPLESPTSTLEIESFDGSADAGSREEPGSSSSHNVN
jgi:hypothetical protein